MTHDAGAWRVPGPRIVPCQSELSLPKVANAAGI